jgi:serine/threonine-protein kinase RsbW
MQPNYVIELPNDLCAIEEPVAYLIHRASEAGFDENRLRLNLRVGLSEALTNAILYGNCRDPRKRVRIEAQVGPGEVTVRVTDEGHGFDPCCLDDPTEPDNRRRERGRGIFLIRQMMDYVEFNDTGNSVTMVLLNPAPVENGATT